MIYAEGGAKAMLGDEVSLDGGRGFFGVVVAVIGEAYDSDFPEVEWAYLKEGLLVQTAEAGLLHFPTTTPEIVLVARSS